MTEPESELKPKSKGVRQFVFVLLVSSAMAWSFFPAGRADGGPVTQLAMRFSEELRETIGDTARNLPRLRFVD